MGDPRPSRPRSCCSRPGGPGGGPGLGHFWPGEPGPLSTEDGQLRHGPGRQRGSDPGSRRLRSGGAVPIAGQGGQPRTLRLDFAGSRKDGSSAVHFPPESRWSSGWNGATPTAFRHGARGGQRRTGEPIWEADAMWRRRLRRAAAGSSGRMRRHQSPDRVGPPGPPPHKRSGRDDARSRARPGTRRHRSSTKPGVLQEIQPAPGSRRHACPRAADGTNEVRSERHRPLLPAQRYGLLREALVVRGQAVGVSHRRAPGVRTRRAGSSPRSLAPC